MTHPAELEPDTSELAAAEGNLGTVTDDEYFEATYDCPVGREEDTGLMHHPLSTARDLRRHPQARRAEIRRDLTDRSGGAHRVEDGQ